MTVANFEKWVSPTAKCERNEQIAPLVNIQCVSIGMGKLEDRPNDLWQVWRHGGCQSVPILSVRHTALYQLQARAVHMHPVRTCHHSLQLLTIIDVYDMCQFTEITNGRR